MSSDNLVNVIDRKLRDVTEHSLKQLVNATSVKQHTEYIESIQEDFRGIERDIEELEWLAEEAPSEHDRIQISDKVSQCRNKLSQVKVNFRSTALSTKRKVDSVNTANARAELFKGASLHSTERKPAGGDDTLMGATSQVTDSLRRTMQLMQQELDKSVLSNQMLEQSSATLKMTGDQYSTFTNLLASSKNLITALERADFLDRILILAALIFFGLVCFYILKRRILDKGLRVVGLASKLIPNVPIAKLLKRSSSLSPVMSSASSSFLLPTASALKQKLSSSPMTSTMASSQALEPSTTSMLQSVPMSVPSFTPSSSIRSSSDTLFDDVPSPEESLEIDQPVVTSEESPPSVASGSSLDLSSEFSSNPQETSEEAPGEMLEESEKDVLLSETSPFPEKTEQTSITLSATTTSDAYPTPASDALLVDDEGFYTAVDKTPVLVNEDFLATMSREAEMEEALEEAISKAFTPVFGKETRSSQAEQAATTKVTMPQRTPVPAAINDVSEEINNDVDDDDDDEIDALIREHERDEL